MNFESLFLEVLGVGSVVGIAYLVTNFVAITPYDYSYSKDHNRAIFFGIPAAVYVTYRVYFGICFFLSALTPKKFRYLEWYLSTLLVSGGIVGALFIPTVQPTIIALFDLYVGDIYGVLYDVSKPELVKAYGFSQRVLGLIAGWFALLFVVELAVRLVVFIVVSLLRAVGILAKPKVVKRVVKKADSAEAVSSEGEGADADSATD